jgi:ribosomal protein S18 acetylase RimI-like enzyme
VAEPTLLDASLARRLVVHEARAQVSLGRELRNLGDGWLLHDPADPEPFWNRLVGPSWPVDAAGFDRRLDEVITLFATLDRVAHVRPMPIGGRPADLADRLLDSGFERVGADRRMVLRDPMPCRAAVESWEGRPPDRLTVERYPNPSEPALPSPDWAAHASGVLAEAFGVDLFRRIALETDLLACAARRGCSILLLRDDGEAVSVARRATVGEGSYLSSIGTRPSWRGRGHATLVTSLAVADALAAGSSLIHLAVDLDNEHARRFYEGLGFQAVGGPVPDLLLR